MSIISILTNPTENKILSMKKVEDNRELVLRAIPYSIVCKNKIMLIANYISYPVTVAGRADEGCPKGKNGNFTMARTGQTLKLHPNGF